MIPLTELLLAPMSATRAIAFGQNKSISAESWQQQVFAFAGHYQQQNNQHYLLWCQSALQFSIQLFALWAAGKTVIMPANGQHETLQKLSDNIDAVVSDDRELLRAAQDLALPVQATGELLTTQIFIPRVLATTKPILTLYTSGSSGDPKAVSRTLQQLQAELDTLHAQLKPDSDVTVIGAVPHQHIYGLLFRLLWPLSEGWPFVDEVADYPEPMLALLQRHAPAMLVASPAQLQRFPEQYDWPAFAAAVERCFSSGAPLPLDAALQMHAATGQAPIEVLGSTETGGVAFRQRNGQEQVWRRFDSVACRLSDEGCLEVCSPAASVEGWFAMGDKAELLDEQHLRLLGRADRIVKVEGKRLSLTEMEQCLLACPEIDQCALTVCYHNRDIVAAVIVLSEQGEQRLQREGRKALAEYWRQHLLGQFERVLLPRWFRYLPALPVDARGKTTQQALQLLFSEATGAEPAISVQAEK